MSEQHLPKMGFLRDNYIDLYSEFEAMKNRGEKTTYAVLYLANKYSVCERKVYDVIKRFGKRCTFGAV